MARLLDSSGSAMRDLDRRAMRGPRFGSLSRSVATLVGRPWAFAVAVFAVVAWGLSGPIFGFSDTWQLIINTSTTIITFLMVFVIQNTQNRDTAAIQIKLDELIRATQGAHNALLDLEELEEDELRAYLRHYEDLASAARERLGKGQLDTNSPDIKAFKTG
jgi:low affinity Fe/Cu permease